MDITNNLSTQPFQVTVTTSIDVQLNVFGQLVGMKLGQHCRKVGRAFVYSAAATRDQMESAVANELVHSPYRAGWTL